MKFRFTIKHFPLITLLLLMPVFFSCTKDSTSMNPNYQISLTAEAGVTEAWLTVQTEEAETGQQIVLRRGNSEIQRFAAVADTTVIDQGLQPAHSYNYTAQLLEGGKMLKEAVAAITTKDSASTNPTLQIRLTTRAGVTEVWLTVHTEEAQAGQQVVLLRGNSEIYRFAATADTTVVEDSLQPAHSYNYTAQLLEGAKVLKQAASAVTTMGATSHDFSWEIDTIGTRSSVLNDVFIINENDIWAVGEIHTAETDTFDSLGNWVPPYNAVHWDGSEWELKHIYVEYHGMPNWAPLEGVFALPTGEIIFSSGLPYLPEGNGWRLYHLWDMGVLHQTDGGVPRIWGTSLNNLYFAGRRGTIVHYDGQGWQRLESGTTLTIRDIWGSENPNTGEIEILCIASNKYFNQGSKLLRIKDNMVIEIPAVGLSWSLSGIWFVIGMQYYIAGDGIYPSSSPGLVWERDISFPAIYKDAIRGTGLNNIAVSGSNGLLSHFNGRSWRHYLYTELPFFSGRYYAVDIKESAIVAVGQIDNKGIVTRGYR